MLPPLATLTFEAQPGQVLVSVQTGTRLTFPLDLVSAKNLSEMLLEAARGEPSEEAPDRIALRWNGGFTPPVIVLSDVRSPDRWSVATIEPEELPAADGDARKANPPGILAGGVALVGLFWDGPDESRSLVARVASPELLSTALLSVVIRAQALVTGLDEGIADSPGKSITVGKSNAKDRAKASQQG